MALFALYSHQKIEFFRKLGFFSQPDVVRKTLEKL